MYALLPGNRKMFCHEFVAALYTKLI